MKRSKLLKQTKEQISDTLRLPKDLAKGEALVSITGQEEAFIENYKGILAERYQITEEGTSVEVLEAIARARGCLKKQEELDYAKASLILFDDFRSGKMGRITLEWAPL